MSAADILYRRWQCRVERGTERENQANHGEESCLAPSLIPPSPSCLDLHKPFFRISSSLDCCHQRVTQDQDVTQVSEHVWQRMSRTGFACFLQKAISKNLIFQLKVTVLLSLKSIFQPTTARQSSGLAYPSFPLRSLGDMTAIPLLGPYSIEVNKY